MRALGWMAGGMGLGVGLMYLADPRSGRRRRAVAHDRALHAVHEAEDAARLVARDLAHRTRGFIFNARSRLRREELDDRTIEARIRSALGRVCSHPHALQVHVEQGRVRLDGVALKAEHAKILSRVLGARGVRDVKDNLQVFHQPGSHPELQGGAVRSGERPEFLQRNWSPAARFVAGLGGASLLTWGLTRRGAWGMASSCIGFLLTLRSITNIELKCLTGVGCERLAIEIHKDITVHAPVEEVFGFWRALENFSRFMSHVEEVQPRGEDYSHWKVKGPAGTFFEWDAVITRLIPNRVLAWRSVEGSMVENTGIIHFEPIHDGRDTRLDIRLFYNPPAGALGHTFALLLGADPKKQMNDDLMQFKAHIEANRAMGHEILSHEQPEPRPVH